MGGQQSKGINPKTPLGCILKHWRELGGIPGGNLSKKTFLKYCQDWWPLYKLDDGEKWPPEGSLNSNTILQLMLFLRRMGKWDEVMYADMFFTLRNKLEWQKSCGINIAPQDPFVLALERDQRNRKQKERCRDACSIGQRCLNLRRKSKEESVISLQELQLQSYMSVPTDEKDNSRLESLFEKNSSLLESLSGKKESTPQKPKKEDRESGSPELGGGMIKDSPQSPEGDREKNDPEELEEESEEDKNAKDIESGGG